MNDAHDLHWRVVWRRRLAKYSRWLHIYVSMTSFVIVFFFAATGITLNHADWFSDAERVTEGTGVVDPKWTNTGASDVAKLEIVESLRRQHRVGGALSDFRVDDQQCAVSFKGPGYSADAVIDRHTGTYQLTETRLGLVAIVNDLHKGRDTGSAWRMVIDIAAGLLTFISLTGLVLIYFVHRHRTAGVVLLASGGVLVYLAYAIWVP
jgi:uncharacterized protein